MSNSQTLEIPISGMDCAECTQHVQHAIEKLPGVQSVNVFLGTEKAIVQLDPTQVNMPTIRSAVQGAGYDVPASDSPKPAPISMGDFNRRLTFLLVIVFTIILSITTRLHITTRFRFLQRDFKVYTHRRAINREGDRHESKNQTDPPPRRASATGERAQAIGQNEHMRYDDECRGIASFSSSIPAIVSTS